jgi:hypothetical protein
MFITLLSFVSPANSLYASTRMVRTGATALFNNLLGGLLNRLGRTENNLLIVIGHDEGRRRTYYRTRRARQRARVRYHLQELKT